MTLRQGVVGQRVAQNAPNKSNDRMHQCTLRLDHEFSLRDKVNFPFVKNKQVLHGRKNLATANEPSRCEFATTKCVDAYSQLT